MATVEEMTTRIVEIACYGVSHELTDEERARLANEVEMLAGDLYEINENRRFKPQPGRTLPASDYLGEKLVGLLSFTRMALGAEERGGYTPENIIENVESYESAVLRLIG